MLKHTSTYSKMELTLKQQSQEQSINIVFLEKNRTPKRQFDCITPKCSEGIRSRLNSFYIFILPRLHINDIMS